MKTLGWKWIGMSLLAGLMVLGIGTGSAEAATFEGDDTYTLPAGETLNDDLFVSAETILIDGDVNGDLFIGGSDITINGDIDGNVFIGGTTVIINGDVSGDIFAGAGELTLNGTADDVRVGGNEITINGTVGDEFMAGAGTVTINGTVMDDAYIGAENLNFGGDAVIRGKLNYSTPEEVPAASDVAASTEYAESQEFEFNSDVNVGFAPFRWVFRMIFAVLGYLLLAFLMNRFAPHWLDRPSDTIESRLGGSLGWGLLSLLLAPFILIVVASITGIFFGFGAALAVAFTGFSGLGLLSLISPIFIARWLGERYLDGTNGFYIAVAAVAVLISLPFVGGIFGLVSFIAVLGSMILLSTNGREKTVAA